MDQRGPCWGAHRGCREGDGVRFRFRGGTGAGGTEGLGFFAGVSAEVFGEGLMVRIAGDDAAYLSGNLRGARGPDDPHGDANKVGATRPPMLKTSIGQVYLTGLFAVRQLRLESGSGRVLGSEYSDWDSRVRRPLSHRVGGRWDAGSVSAFEPCVRHFVICIWRGGAAFGEVGSVWPWDFGVMSAQVA